MPGAGLQSAGTSSAGYGTSEEATAPGGAILRDEKTGKSHSARKIDPRTGRYEIDQYGRLLGMNHVRQAVQVSLLTEVNTSAVRGLGHRLKSLQRITPNFERAVLAILTEAVQPLVARGYIEVVGFKEFQKGDGKNGMQRGGVYGRFLWRDLTTKQVHTELI